MEWYFKASLYRWEYIQADMVAENFFPVRKHFTMTDIGLGVQEDVKVTDAGNHIVSHNYIDQLDTMDKAEALRLPEIKADAALDARRAQFAGDILEGILPVRLQGSLIYHAPWDNIPRLRGVTNTLTDLIAEPGLMHAVIKKFTDYGHSCMKQMEALNLLDSEQLYLHCTPGYVTGLAAKTGEAVTLKNVWFRGMAQLFTDVSTDMWEEFELQYMKPLMAECGLVYYGCCEALDKKIPLLKTVPNMRKIGVSPWANAEVCAEQIAGDYVFAHKPNPAFVSGNFDEEVVRKEISRVIEACHACGCPYEFVLKDISTVGYKPENLIAWTRTVGEVIGGYYSA
jgi:hypothetical protein